MGFLGFGGKRFTTSDLDAFAQLAGTSVKAVLDTARARAQGMEEEAVSLEEKAAAVESRADQAYQQAVTVAKATLDAVYEQTAPIKGKSKGLCAEAAGLQENITKFS